MFSETDIMKKLDIFACFIIIGGRVLKRRSVFALVPNLDTKKKGLSASYKKYV
jgi:hypothetical protein